MFQPGRVHRKRTSGAVSVGTSSGAGCLIPFGLFFGGLGLVAFVFMTREFIADAKTRDWAEVPAEILRCEIGVDEGNRDAPFHLEVAYRYVHEGQTHTSTRYARNEKRSDDYEKLALRRAAYFKGDGSVPCYVNPENPDEAILVRESLWGGLLALLPLIFVVIGGGLVWGGVASLRKEKRAAEAPEKPLSLSAKKRSTQAGPAFLAVFGLIFFSVGLGLLFPFGITPFRNSRAAINWTETPCEILWSRVQSHSSDDGTTYSVDIFFQYEFAGATHRSNRYSFASGSTSGRGPKEATVRRYPRGSQQTCYVDPAQPERAVLERSRDALGYWFLLPLVFAVIGLLVGIGGLNAFLKSRKSKPVAEALRPTTPGVLSATSDPSPRTLDPGKSRLGALLGAAIAALFWNGILSLFFFSGEAQPSGRDLGFFDYLPLLFMLPFAAVGLALIAGTLYLALGLFNPKVTLVLTPGTPRLGDNAHLSWKLKGSPSRLRSLRIFLIGSEVATYQRGTTTHTDREPFYAQVLTEESNTLAYYQGEATFQLPFDLIATLDSGHNRIEWEIRVVGDIKPGPDIGDTFKIDLLPATSA